MKRSFTVGPHVTCDLDRLISTRLLVQANSGGGKSWALRRLLEQTHGRVQQIVIDPEGEFASLRAKFDYVLAARQGGDTLADPRTAKLLAERLLELNVSAIIDIYELKMHERVRFVKLFLDALVDAPKTLWHPALIVLDEAHMFCPEKGEAESADAVKSLATRGRKRGFCAVFATQRLSKFSKDAAAECNNKLIGRTSLDVDMARAGDELGFVKADRLKLRDLKPGEFFAFGPALSNHVTLTTVGDVQTEHPKAGALEASAPPPSEKVKALLPKLSDLPAEAEAREKTVADLKRDLANARRELTEARKAQPVPKAETITVERFVLKDGQLARAEKALERFEHAAGVLGTAMAEIAAAVTQTRQPAPPVARPSRSVSALPVRPVKAAIPTHSQNGEGLITPAKQKILNGLAFLAGIGIAEADKTQLALIVGVSPTSGGYFNNLGALRSSGLIAYPSGGAVALTDAGADIASTDGVPTTTEELHRAIQAKLPPAKWKILEEVIRVYPEALTKDDLADRIGVSPTSGGYFNNLGSLRSLGLIDYPRPSEVAARPVLFLEER